jgi:membrane-bound lytic murein transglycosylase B
VLDRLVLASLIAFALGYGASAIAAQAASNPQPPAPVQTLDPPPATPPEVSRPSFSEWLAGVRTEALERGVREEVVDQALSTVEEPVISVLERDRTQAESVLSLEAYLSRRLTAAIVRTGRQKMALHRSLLDKVAAQYEVPASTLVAIWGAESNFGRFSGVRPTIPALATLAFDPRRSTLFRRELLSALEILDRGHIELAAMRGSWAGAMGQPQFMPSSYLRYAQDFDGDGRRDIWDSAPDIFASIANYLKGAGWIGGKRWGREVKVSKEAASRIAADVAPRDGSCQARRRMTVALPLAEWQRLGVRLPDGRPLPSADQPASLVSGSTRYFLVYDNYDVLLDYNCAHAYALSVALLSDRLATGR